RADNKDKSRPVLKWWVLQVRSLGRSLPDKWWRVADSTQALGGLMEEYFSSTPNRYYSLGAETQFTLYNHTTGSHASF
ncbi:hypothetical protein J6590_104364, partial [Homalodisca vitripennis]